MLTLFNTKTYESKVMDEHWVEVDKDILDVIVLLNQKGYLTENSCAGHWKPLTIHDENGSHDATEEEMRDLDFEPNDLPYVSFKEGIEIPSTPVHWESVKYDGKENLYVENPEEVYTESLAEAERKRYLRYLMEWAETLPVYHAL